MFHLNQPEERPRLCIKSRTEASKTGEHRERKKKRENKKNKISRNPVKFEKMAPKTSRITPKIEKSHLLDIYSTCTFPPPPSGRTRPHPLPPFFSLESPLLSRICRNSLAFVLIIHLLVAIWPLQILTGNTALTERKSHCRKTTTPPVRRTG